MSAETKRGAAGTRLSRRGATCGLVAIVGLAAALRLYRLGQHFFWFDEGLLLDLDLLEKSAGRFTLTVWHTTTYNPGWAIVVWLTSRVGGVALWSARFPSCVAGIVNVALTYPTARALKLDRIAALAAALLTALAWPQVEYSQQILPYAAVPLMTTVVLWLVAKLSGDSPARVARAWCPLLALACVLDVLNHNSFLMLVPFLAITLAAVAAKLAVARGDREARRGLRALVACLCCVILASLCFFLPKRGEGYRTYLDPYYLATFRDLQTPDRPFTDTLYRRCVPESNLALDALYFGVSRTYDTFRYSTNLFSPVYVDRVWGLLAAPLVGLSMAGLAGSLRGRPGHAPRWLGRGFVLTLGVLFVLSTTSHYPYGGIRQLLFISPFVIVSAAAGWRAALGRWPVAVGGATVIALGTYSLRAPEYYTQTASRLDEPRVAAILNQTDIRTIVVPDFGAHYFVLNHLCRERAERPIIDIPWPAFATVLHRHEPFLLYSTEPFRLSDFTPGSSKSVYYLNTIEPGFDFGQYDVQQAVASRGGAFRGGQPNLGTFVYSFRPRPTTPGPVGAETAPRVLSTEPADGTWTARLLTEVAVEFSHPMDPTTLTPETVQLWSQARSPENAPWERCSYGEAVVDYSAAWNTAILRVNGPRKPARYTIVVKEGARDAAGRPLDGGEFMSSFRLELPARR